MDGAYHTWDSMEKKHSGIAKNQFNNKEINFNTWSPYVTSELYTQKTNNNDDNNDISILMYSGRVTPLKEYAQKLDKQIAGLREGDDGNQSIKYFKHTPTQHLHCAQPFLEEYGTEIMNFLSVSTK